MSPEFKSTLDPPSYAVQICMHCVEVCYGLSFVRVCCVDAIGLLHLESLSTPLEVMILSTRDSYYCLRPQEPGGWGGGSNPHGTGGTARFWPKVKWENVRVQLSWFFWCWRWIWQCLPICTSLFSSPRGGQRAYIRTPCARLHFICFHNSMPQQHMGSLTPYPTQAPYSRHLL